MASQSSRDSSKRKQRTQPKGRDKKTGKPHEPIEIPVPKRGEVEDLLKRAARRQGGE